MFTHIAIPTLQNLTTESIHGKRFYVTPTGERYPSVTTILGNKEKPGLEKWRQMLGDKKADKEAKRCATRGNAVHELIECHLNNKQIINNDHKPEYIAGFNQVKLQLKNINNIRVQEAALYSDTLKIAGRVDCIGEFKGIPSVIDFKTSTNNKTRDHVFDYFLQCTAYSLMWYEMTGELMEHIVIIMASEKGMVPLKFEDNINKYIKPLNLRIDDFYKGLDK